MIVACSKGNRHQRTHLGGRKNAVTVELGER
jgi:hypothetical protein